MEADQDTNFDMVYYLFRTFIFGVMEIFKILDSDNNGSISIGELKRVIKDDNFDINKYRQLSLKPCNHGDPKEVNFKEFISIITQENIESGKIGSTSDKVDLIDMTHTSFQLCLIGLKKYFDSHDTNGDGQITGDELQSFQKAMGQRMTDKEAKSVIANADLDGDNQLSFKEFVLAISSEFWEIEMGSFMMNASATKVHVDIV